jgi:short-subunit dehydrogenase
LQLEKVTALITGASGGIGQAIARQLVEAGSLVIISGRNTQRLNESKLWLGDQCLAVHNGDLTQPQSQSALIELAEKFKINVLINAMGVNRLSFLDEQTSAGLAESIGTNLIAPLQLTTALLPTLAANGPAQIVNIGSIFGSIGHPGYVPYCAAKFGLRGFSEALGRELSNSKIEVLYVAPRATKTNMNSVTAVALNKALGTTVDPVQVVAEQVLLSMRKKRSRAYLGWPEKLFVRINGLFPRLVDRAIAKQLPTIERIVRKTEKIPEQSKPHPMESQTDQNNNASRLQEKSL